ncbi:MAG: xanthine dehydrogenase family protein subunit M [Dehalococcoidia bacterium]|nr:xanthine dehydrogenase family protein subunit M [Dehalococcoidia bacterium]
MQARNYVAPSSIDEAVAALQAGNGANRAFAGGTDVIIQVRENRRAVDTLVDIKSIPELIGITHKPDGGLRLGAATPCAQIYRDPQVKARFPALVDSASLIGGVQIQSRASLGGNLCNSSPAADSIPTLIALGAIAEIAGPSGRRNVAVEDFCTGPGQNVLQPGELLVALEFPSPAANSGAAFERFIPRNEMDIAVVNAAANITLSADGSTFQAARIAIGAVAPTPLYVAAAGQALAGKPVNDDSIAAAAEAARAAATPITDMRGSAAQRKHLVGVLVTSVLRTAIDRARG